MNVSSRVTAVIAMLLISTFVPYAVSADILYVIDGSRINGQISQMTETAIKINTSFAGEISVPLKSLVGVTSETVQKVALRSGDRINARPYYDPETGTQHLKQTSFGDVTIAAGELVGVRSDGDPSPEALALETELEKYRSKVKKYDDAWSGSIALGMTGTQGNTKNLGFNGRAEAKRDVGRDRQLVYAQGRMQENEEILSAKEIMVGISAEHDLDDRWFVYAREELEHDKFENLDLRSVTGAGLGYWLIRKDDHELKPRLGLAYEFEAFNDGSNNRDAVLALGYDYLIRVNEWYKFTHNVTFYPALTDPTKDFRVDSNIGFEFPIASSDQWGFRLGLRNQYNNQPSAGRDKLDTSYTADVVFHVD
ncbi:MAG: DUF481 domain-containing protein [Gammaproteobacteria bacterium]